MSGPEERPFVAPPVTEGNQPNLSVVGGVPPEVPTTAAEVAQAQGPLGVEPSRVVRAIKTVFNEAWGLGPRETTANHFRPRRNFDAYNNNPHIPGLPDGFDEAS